VVNEHLGNIDVSETVTLNELCVSINAFSTNGRGVNDVA
jgi:hypothetical protein